MINSRVSRVLIGERESSGLVRRAARVTGRSNAWPPARRERPGVGDAAGEREASAGPIRSGPPDWLLRVLAGAQELDAALGDPRRLEEVARQVGQVARELGCDAVAGASPHGCIVAGAASVLSAGALSVWDRTNGVGRQVLVVEGVMATGTQMLRAANSVRERGAQSVAGVALVAAPVALVATRTQMRAEVVAFAEL